MRIIRQSSFAALPWKNGGGVTREAIRVPPHDDSFDWRVSVAEIDSSGPFSYFAEYQRFMVLLRGAGLLLRFSRHSEMKGSQGAGGRIFDRVRELREVGDLVEFDGGLATQCELTDGPCVDLNLMVAKTLRGVQVWVEELREARSFPIGSNDSMLVFPLDAAAGLSCGGTTNRLEPWDLALLSGGEREVLIAGGLEEGDGREENARLTKVFLATVPNINI